MINDDYEKMQLAATEALYRILDLGSDGANILDDLFTDIKSSTTYRNLKFGSPPNGVVGDSVIMQGDGFKAVRTDTRITLWSLDNNTYFGELPTNASETDIHFAMKWYRFGETRGVGVGAKNAKAKIREALGIR